MNTYTGKPPLRAGGRFALRLLLLGTAWAAPVWASEPAIHTLIYTNLVGVEPEIWIIDTDGSNHQRLGSGSSGSWSRDGERLAFTLEVNGNRDIYLMDADGSNRVRLTQHPAADNGPSWSADGSMIAFNSSRSGSDQIWRSNVEAGSWGYNLTQLTQDSHNQRVNNYLSWSPDGRWIAFEADRDRDDPEIYLANAVDGSNQQRLTYSLALDEVPSWSPDGARILFSSDRHDAPLSKNYDIYIMQVDGSALTRLTVTPGAASWPSMSSDGRYIAYSYQAPESSESQLWIMDADGSNPRLLLKGGTTPRLSP